VIFIIFILGWPRTGLSEAEGSFSIKIDSRKSFSIYFVFRIEMIKRDYPLLLKIQNFFKCGTILYNSSKDSYIFGVYNSPEGYRRYYFNPF